MVSRSLDAVACQLNAVSYILDNLAAPEDFARSISYLKILSVTSMSK